MRDIGYKRLLPQYANEKIQLADIPEEIIEEYKFCEIVTDDSYVYSKIRKGMYGLPQAGLLAQELLEQRLSKV
jgi:hypothetical protein